MFPTRGGRAGGRVVGVIAILLGLLMMWPNLQDGDMPDPIAFGILLMGGALLFITRKPLAPAAPAQPTAVNGAPVADATPKANPAIGLLVALLIGGGTYFYMTNKGDVTIRVEGRGSALISYGAGGNQSQTTERLPWSTKVSADTVSGIAVVAQRNEGGSGTISCSIISGGSTVASQSSSGAYAVVTCAGRR